MQKLRAILPFLRPYRLALAAGLLLVTISNGFQVAAPLLIGRGVDALGRPDVDERLILAHAGLVVLAALLAGGARFGMRQILNGISRRVETDLRDAFLMHLLRLDASFFQRQRTGDLMSRATNDTQAVRMAAGPAIMYLVNTIVLTAFAVALMLRISPSLTAATLAPLLLLAPAVLGFGRVIHRRFEHIQEQFGELSTLVQENLAGIRIVRAYGQEASQQADFDALNQAYRHKNMALARVSGVFHPLLTLLAGASMAVLVWVGGSQIVAGRITAGDFIAFAFFLGMLAWPMIALGWVINLFQQGAASMGRIQRILETEPLVREPAPAAPVEHFAGAIRFTDVHFTYPGSERPVLRGVSFAVEAGSTVALVGPTGSGKSTIVALLARLYDPSRGEITLDGQPLRTVPLRRLRGALGVVPQDAFLFSETIEENLALGLPEGGAPHRDDRTDRIRWAANVAHLEESVRAFPAGYATRLGERGVNLSGGQRQRATLARALARDPAVLVLDDSLSAVDTETESRILDGLRQVLAGRTSVIVSHRVSAVMHADQILVLDDGQIAEQGTHGELVARGRLYASLLRRQLIEEGLEAIHTEPLATGTGPL
jgi:ATP-binding cassette subfamily B multidrug efflux pump